MKREDIFNILENSNAAWGANGMPSIRKAKEAFSLIHGRYIFAITVNNQEIILRMPMYMDPTDVVRWLAILKPDNMFVNGHDITLRWD